MWNSICAELFGLLQCYTYTCTSGECLAIPTYRVYRLYDNIYNISYSYTIALSGLFELYTRGGCLNHEVKPSGLNARLERTIQ